MTDPMAARETAALASIFPMKRTISPFHPPPEYAQLREQCPVARVNRVDGTQIWMITGHAEATIALKDPRLSSDMRSPGFPWIGGGGTQAPDVTATFRRDPPDHTAVRRVLAGDFTPRRVRELRPAIQAVVDQALITMVEMGKPVDLVQAVALPVPSMVICHLLGLPYAEHEFFQLMTKTVHSQNSDLAEIMRAYTRTHNFLLGQLDLKRRHPADDILTRLVDSQDQLEFDDFEVCATVRALLNAGHETTANMISLGTLYLLSHPEELAELRSDPSLWPAAVEELVRFLSIADLVMPRAALDDIELGGQLIRRGEGVFILNAAVNRDSTVFTNADKFDMHRRDHSHLAFGYGLHQCIGQHLARAELEILYVTLFTRFPDLRLAVPMEQLPFKDAAAIFGLQEMPVTW